MSASARPPFQTVALPGLGAIEDRFDGFIVDQWGVLHDGSKPYPGALECLRRLRDGGRRVVVLSNSGKLSEENVRRMAAAGFPPDSYDRFISAGEDARQALISRTDPAYRELGPRCLALRRADDGALLTGLGLVFVTQVEAADFLFLVGVPESHGLVETYAKLLEQAAVRRLPMICANPDLSRVTPSGLAEAPGILARYYEEIGGLVHYHGKPHLPIYRSSLEEFPGVPHDRILMIGDSVEHDIVGAGRAGLPSALVVSGIHAEQLEVTLGELPSPERWSAFASMAPAIPEYLLPGFLW